MDKSEGSLSISQKREAEGEQPAELLKHQKVLDTKKGHENEETSEDCSQLDTSESNDDAGNSSSNSNDSVELEGEESVGEEEIWEDLESWKDEEDDDDDDDESEMSDSYSHSDLFNSDPNADDSAVSISDCDEDEWMASSRQMADFLYGIKNGGEARFVKNVANVIWKKEDLAMSYVPGFESPSVPSFTEFVPTKKPLDLKRLNILRREYFQFKTGAFGLKIKNIDWEKEGLGWVLKADKYLADYMATLNKLGGLYDTDFIEDSKDRECVIQ